jgi:ubiquinone/menaquinone biosynthesis C-methylase UbiE
MSDKAHWEKVYADRGSDSQSWFQQYPARSLELIASCGADRDAVVIDVGGGASGLTAELLRLGYPEPWVLDISAAALAAARRHLGESADRVHWVEADVTSAPLPSGHFDIWHDRAVFHFLVTPADRQAYVSTALRAIKPGGHLIIATFAEDGPERCSGLPVSRYDAVSLAAQFGNACAFLQTEKEVHRTPAGKAQSFRYTLMRLKSF